MFKSAQNWPCLQTKGYDFKNVSLGYIDLRNEQQSAQLKCIYYSN